MAEFLIIYRDSSGNEEERCISDINADSMSTIDAYCELRQARRTFRIDRIIYAVNLQTGEIINPWIFINGGVGTDNRETLNLLTWDALPAIKALNFFMKTTRGGRKREIDILVQFIQEITDVTSYSYDELSDWIKNLWCGGIQEYIDGYPSEYVYNLKLISPLLLERCRYYALLIAMGSGRKPIDKVLLERIKNEFSPDPIVKKPKQPKNSN